jgi:hypothetical protein
MHFEGIGVVVDVEARGLPVGDDPTNQQFAIRELIDPSFVVACVQEIEIVVGRQ